MVYSVIIPFCRFGEGGCQEKNNILGKSSIRETMMFCGGAPGAKERSMYKDNQSGYWYIPHKPSEKRCIYVNSMTYELPG